MKKLLIVSGELSGSLYASKLVEELPPWVKVFGVFTGEVKGAEKLFDASTITAFGLFEGLKKLPSLIKAKRKIEEFIERERPDAVLLIDFPGFNLKVAEVAKKRGVRVFYFIPPKLWAWGAWRVKKLKALVDRLFLIFPFEVDFYRSFGVEAVFVGNPLVDMVRPELSKSEFLSKTSLSEPLFTLMPGSRESEVNYLLKPLLETAKEFNGSWAIPVASTVNYEKVKKLRDEVNPSVALLSQSSRYSLMAYSKAGVIASGTASLEGALSLLPHAVVYRLNSLTFALAKRLVKTKFVSLPNIIAGREILPELLQERVNPKDIRRALEGLLEREEEVRRALKEEVVERLPGGCFKRLSEELAEELS